MNKSASLPRNFVAYLSMEGLFDDVEFFVAYDNSTKPVPIVKPIVTLCTKKVNIGNRVNQVGDDGKIYLSNKRNVTTVLKLTIHVPYEMGASEAFKLFDAIYSKLIFIYDTDILSAVCYGAEYVRDLGSIVLDSEFSVKSLESS